MNTNTNTRRRFARYFALPIVSAGIIGGAALGLAGTASAAATDVQQPNIVATPNVTAHPAPDATPGWRWHHGIHHLQDLQPGYTR
jgi:Spy/CpxP family protein refolding chaperone